MAGTPVTSQVMISLWAGLGPAATAGAKSESGSACGLPGHFSHSTGDFTLTVAVSARALLWFANSGSDESTYHLGACSSGWGYFAPTTPARACALPLPPQVTTWLHDVHSVMMSHDMSRVP